MKIGIIGAGKVGISLGYVLRGNGLDVAAIADRLPSALETARGFLGADMIYTADVMEVVGSCNVVAITTQDREIAGVARGIFEAAGDVTGKVFFHTSGADPSSILSPLGDRGAHLGSLHPLQTFPDIESAIEVLPDTSIFIEGDEKALAVLRVIAGNLGAAVHTIAGEDKVFYHLAAVFVCNLLSALMYSGMGIMDRIDVGFEPFLSIIRATMKNIESLGPLAALTCPVVRGDDKTIRSHLAAMEDMPLHREIYLALSKMALEMVRERKTLSEAETETLRRLLEGE
jgi:predicted short-subunit dehydrogenase-like oxidoreductase (DUF2520 family)